MTQDCLIVGASHAAAQLATSLRQGGWTGAIRMIGDEGAPALPATTAVQDLPVWRAGCRELGYPTRGVLAEAEHRISARPGKRD